LVVRREIHSCWGNEKKVKQDSREVSKVLKAEGICFSPFFLNVSKNSKAFCLDEAMKVGG
jgi:hypothetical protein